MPPYVWDEWPQFFRGRLRVLYDELGAVNHRPLYSPAGAATPTSSVTTRLTTTADGELPDLGDG